METANPKSSEKAEDKDKDHLEKELSEQKEENERLRRENLRLREKLQRSGDYAEELRLQVERLGTKISKCNLSSKMSLTTEEDFREAALKWHGHKQDPSGKTKKVQIYPNSSLF